MSTENPQEEAKENLSLPEAPQEKHEEPQKRSVTEGLPMVVQLKGYEDYYEEFSWDAKKVMEVLGIKRSRLNQISGEELRVGKARIDRYLRPIYRPEDVKKYLEWTQPTASHKRSTSIIDEARLKLDQTSGELKEKLVGSQEALKEELSSLLGKMLVKLTRNYEDVGDSLSKNLRKAFSQSSEELLFEQKQNLKRSLKLEEKIESFKASQEASLLLFQKIEETMSQQTLLKKELIAPLEALAKRMECLESDQKNFQESLTEELGSLKKHSLNQKNIRLSLSERKQIQCLKNFKPSLPLRKKSKSLSVGERKKLKPSSF